MLKMSWDAFRDKSEKQMKDVEQQHADELKEWESKYNDLQIELGMAKKELVESKEKVANLRMEIQALELEMANRLNELKGKLVAEIKEVATKKDNEISVIKVEAENMRNTLLKEYEILEEKLIESQKGSRALMKDLERAKMELTSELISFKERTQKELNVMQQRLKEKELDLIATKKELDEMQAERQSLRKLLKVQGSLIRDRLAKRFGRKKNKLK
jgi:chromosome segregation ATPase